jgi:hypothetical protein
MSKTPQDRQWLTAEEAAREGGCPLSKIYRLAQKGWVRTAPYPWGRLYHRSDVFSALEREKASADKRRAARLQDREAATSAASRPTTPLDERLYADDGTLRPLYQQLLNAVAVGHNTRGEIYAQLVRGTPKTRPPSLTK